MAVSNNIEYFIGVVSYVENDPYGLLNEKSKEYQEVVCDIPGIIEGIKAYPKRTGNDDPQVGDRVLLSSLDPEFHSYWIYEKLMENGFVGIRSRGKMIDITEEEISIGIFNPNDKYPDAYRPVPDSYIKIKNDGNIEISSFNKIDVKGVNVKVEGENIELDGVNIDIKGNNVNLDGIVVPSEDMSGPFNCIPICPYTGQPHCGKTIISKK
jgi:hypothetical protein